MGWGRGTKDGKRILSYIISEILYKYYDQFILFFTAECRMIKTSKKENKTKQELTNDKFEKKIQNRDTQK